MNEATVVTGSDIVKQLEAEGVKSEVRPQEQQPTVEKPAETTPAQSKESENTIADADKGESLKVETPKTEPVANPNWKDGDKEYTPEQIREALKSHNDFHALMSSAKQKTKDVAKVEAALEPVFKLAEKLAGKGETARAIRDALESEFDADTVKYFDTLMTLKKSELKDPHEAELSEREQALERREFKLQFDDTVEKLAAKESFSEKEKQDFVQLCVDYYAQMGEDDTLPFLKPEELYKQSPLREGKIEAKAKAKAEEEANKKIKAAEEAEKLKRNTPPKPTAGAGKAIAPGSWDDVKADIMASAKEE